MNQTQDDIEAEIADFLGETTVTGTEADWRANVPPGTVLAEGMVEGATVQWLKGSSGVHARGVPLPERTKVYDTRTGVTSMVPTAQLRYQLGKRRPDGSRVYSRTLPEGITQPEPIKDTCKICYVNRGNKHRNFYSEDQLINHMTAFHTNEWNAMERDRDIRERREQGDRMERLVLMFATALRPDIAKTLPAEVREQIEELQATQPRRGRRAAE
jgi:hypothetical protein